MRTIRTRIHRLANTLAWASPAALSVQESLVIDFASGNTGGAVRHPSLWRRIAWLSVGVPAVVLIALADVTSLSLSPTDVPSGGTSTGTVRLSSQSSPNTIVSLTSSKPAVATVPSITSTSRNTGSATFTVRAVPGAAGCTVITAKVGTSQKSETLFVQAPPDPTGLSLSLSQSGVVGPNSLTGTVGVFLPAGQTPTSVQLSSSNPAVTVPATVNVSAVEGGAYIGTFNITTQVVSPTTCSVITATHGSFKARKLLKVFTISG